ncbi:MAG TPA: response regulator, partial [Gallionella sp.]|nr:response regulator [Gallionella sp.]
MDGYDVCRRLKSSAATVNIPVIFLTARLDEADEMKGLALGAIDYITKPINPNILLARVRNHLLLKKLVDFLLDQNEQDTAERIARSLKDISGEIGPEGLQQLAEKLNLSIKSNRLHEEYRGQPAQPVLIAQSVQKIKAEQHKTIMVNQQKLKGVCDRLEELLRNDDAEALNVMDANAELLDIAYPDHSRKIDNSIRSFDFKAALVALRGATGTSA